MPQLRHIELPPVSSGPQFSAGEVQAMQRAVVNLGGRWSVHDDQMATL